MLGETFDHLDIRYTMIWEDMLLTTFYHTFLRVKGPVIETNREANILGEVGLSASSTHSDLVVNPLLQGD